MKYYFVIPELFAQGQNNLFKINLTEYQVNNNSLIEPVFFTEQPNGYFIPSFLFYRFVDENFNILPSPASNAFNFFYSHLGLSFDTNTYFGACTGSQSGSNYGTFTDKIFIDNRDMIDGFGTTQYGSFGLDIDLTQQLRVRFEVQGFRGQNKFYTIEYNPNDPDNFIYTDSDNNDLINYGWRDLNGFLPDRDIALEDRGNVHKSICTTIEIPEIYEEDRGLDVCCAVNLVLASTTDLDSHKNDYFGDFYNTQNSTYSATWELYKDGVLQNTASIFEIDTVNNIQTIYFNWRNVLLAYGDGNYQVKKTISGNSIDLYTIEFTEVELKEFSFDFADGTVRIDSKFNNYLEYFQTNFKDTNVRTSIRIKGGFGNEENNWISENSLNSEYNIINNYKQLEIFNSLFVNGIRNCVWSGIKHFNLMSDSIKITDYNKRNFSYDNIEIDVQIESFEEQSYFNRSRLANQIIKFKNTTNNKISKYG